MRVCSSCGRENPADRDFCECGEYLRWDPTGVVQAVTPEVLQAAEQQAPPAAEAPPADAPAQPAQPAQPQAAPPPAPTQQPPAAHPAARPAPPQAPQGPGNGQGAPLQSGDPLGGGAPPAAPPPAQPPAPPAPAAPPPATLEQPPAPAPAAPAQPAEPDPAAITLRLPDGEQVRLGETLAMGADPGGRARVLALVRNQSGIVDNYELSVRGLPDDWWSIFPNTVYLVPFGTSGTYEQEVEIHLHPPRTAEAEARIWELQVVGESKAYGRQAATAPLNLGIQPFEELKTKLEPQRASGRRKGQFEVAVKNTANAPVTVALDAEDPDNELQVDFSPQTLEVPAGETQTSKMEVRPPRQKWIGRPEEKRISVHTRTGEEALVARAATEAPPEEAPEPAGLDDEEQESAGAKAGGLFKRLGGAGPRANVGPRGVQVTGPRAPQAPRVPSANLQLSQLKVPGGGAQAATAPLQPNQVAFRQKAWLPWWVMLLLPLLILLALLLFLLLPRNVVVPEVTGQKSTFEAEKKLVKADLKLAPAPKEKVSTEAPPGTVIGQTPAAGEKAKKDSEVALEIAVGNGKVQVPSVVGKNQAEAEKILRGKKLTIGQLQPQPPDPKAKISSQIPAAEEVVTEGKPIDIFMATIKDKKKKGGDEKKDGGGGGAAAAVALPALAGQPLAEAAQKAADAGLVPEKVTEFSAKKKGELIRTEPGPGTKVAAGAKVKLVVSGGFPKLVYDDGKNVKLVNGANGKPLPAVAKGSQEETDPTFSADGEKIAFLSNRKLFLKDLSKPDEPPVGLTEGGEKFGDPAWAPTVDSNVIAMFKDKSADGKRSDQDLCFLQVAKEQQAPQCISEPDFNLVKTIRWAPDGKSIYALGTTPTKFGMVQWKSKKPFSFEAKDWGKGKFKTDTSNPRKGVIDFAISPDGKQMVAVANFDADAFQLYLGKPKDVLLVDAKPLGVQACKASWRSDGLEVVVVQADETCSTQANGQIVRVPIKNPSAQQRLVFSGDSPDFQPLTLE
jgi:beta-lactam-binding protein with PASTA domain